jgi:hypothetical protein
MSGVDSDSDAYVKAVPKKKQKTLDDFMSKPKATKAPAPKKAAPVKRGKVFASDDEDSDKDSDGGPSRSPPPKRTATARAGVSKKPTYVDLSSEEDDQNGVSEDQSKDVFELSD